MRYISSEPLLFNMTLMENLRFGNIRDHSDEEIWGVRRLTASALAIGLTLAIGLALALAQPPCPPP